MPRDQEHIKRALHGVVYGILTVTHGQLESFSCDIELPDSDDLPRQEYVDRVVKRQQKLAAAFREFMTRGQSFETANSNRQEFYTRVIKAAKMVNLCYFIVFVTVTYLYFKFDEQCKVAVESSTTNSPAQYVDLKGQGVRTAGKKLCKFLDPRSLMPYEEERWPLVLLSFDEPQVLTGGSWSLFTELRRILQRLDCEGISIFSLFLSTAGNFRLLSPDIKFDPSSRVVSEHLLPFYPITDISFDCLARPTSEGSVSLSQVVQTKWIAHLGRPLYDLFHTLSWKAVLM